MDILIICTKDRPTELRKCLTAVGHCFERPEKILVIDSSIGPETRLAVESLNASKFQKISFISSRPGLTHQRNVGIDATVEPVEIVHFLDDDTIVEPEYFSHLKHIFNTHQDVIAAGGRDTTIPEQGPFLRPWKLRKEGSVSSSGVNHLSRSPHQEPRQVDWLSGCSMSFRASVFQHVRFDERRTGNGVGEDVDFCLRASAFGRILWVPCATLEHHQSPINRFGARKSGYSTIDHRLLLANDRLHTVRRSRVVARGYVESLVRLLRSFVTGSKPQREYALGMLGRLCRNVED